MSDNQPGGQHPHDPKAAAAAAKAYAKASRPWYKKKRFIIPIALVAIIAIAAGASGGGDDSGADTASEDQSESSGADNSSDDAKKSEKGDKAEKDSAEEPAEKPIEVEAVAIIKEFEQNELAADEKYKGKTLEISGRVSKIDTDVWDSDKYILQIGGGGDFELLSVNCHDMDNAELSSLKTGDKVTAIGEFDDGGDLGVEVKDCRLK